MYLYNVTYKIDHAIEEDWMHWMRSTHIPRVVQVGNFLGHRVCKLIGIEENDGVTYAIQYLVPDMPTFQTFQQEHLGFMKTLHARQFGSQYIAFSTVLEIIE